ncbi:cysteine-rich with EGF-like domain protein 2-B isoform X3 [Halichondria panicea]|uniref:cysteine-rich with EGF-like domain protein 2-B n=1 Tax=Halichondria panicea TaxID=6063 RepID=UPI00312BC06E
MDDTAKSNFADGDTNWEEEKLASYANSEVRLIEMLDEHSDYDCHRLLENYEEEIERWWFKLRHKEEGYDDLKQWLCSFCWGHELFCSSVEASFLAIGLVMRPSVDHVPAANTCIH